MFRKLFNYVKRFKRWLLGLFIGGAVILSAVIIIPIDNNCQIVVTPYTPPAREKIRANLIGKTPAEKADYKSSKIVAMDFRQSYQIPYYYNDIKVEIQSIKKIDKGIEILVRACRGNKQLGFGDGSVEIERFKIYNPPILLDDPNGQIIKQWADRETGELQYKRLREDPEEVTKIL